MEMLRKATHLVFVAAASLAPPALAEGQAQKAQTQSDATKADPQSVSSGGGSEKQERFLKATSVADVLWIQTPHTGRLHFDGALALYTGDYYRGRYGGVPNSLDRLSYRLTTTATVELLEKAPDWAPVEALTLSGGLLNYLTDSPVPGEDPWYTNDRYVGLAADLGGGFLAAVTYTAYKNPFSPPGTLQDAAFTLSYSGDDHFGDLHPQIKLVKAVGAGSGGVIEGMISPVYTPNWAKPFSFATPVAIGAGLDGYYRATREDTGYYAEVGAYATLPLDIGAPGSWSLSAGTYTTIRSDSIAGGGPRFDDAGNIVPVGFVALSFTY